MSSMFFMLYNGMRQVSMGGVWPGKYHAHHDVVVDEI